MTLDLVSLGMSHVYESYPGSRFFSFIHKDWGLYLRSGLDTTQGDDSYLKGTTHSESRKDSRNFYLDLNHLPSHYDSYS